MVELDTQRCGPPLNHHHINCKLKLRQLKLKMGFRIYNKKSEFNKKDLFSILKDICVFRSLVAQCGMSRSE